MILTKSENWQIFLTNCENGLQKSQKLVSTISLNLRTHISETQSLFWSARPVLNPWKSRFERSRITVQLDEGVPIDISATYIDTLDRIFNYSLGSEF